MQPPSGPSGAAQAEDALPIDLDHLERQTLGDRELQAELLDLFARQARGILAELDASLGPAKGAAAPLAADLLHTLCGSARAVGSWQVAAAAETMERRLRQSPGELSAPDSRDQLMALSRSVGRACAAIDALRRRNGA